MQPDTLLVRGGTPLTGRIAVRGAKNLVPKAMVASLLGDEPSMLTNVPDISDVTIVTELLELHGVHVTRCDGTLLMDPAAVGRAAVADIEMHAGASRIPILLCGPLVHRLGHAFIPDLGGCRIGDRPIDFHLNALRTFGARVDKAPEGLHITAPHGLRGARIRLPFPSVGATEQVLLTAVRATGVTELCNAALEPEIIDLVLVLQKMGADICVGPGRAIRVTGVERLGGYRHRALADRIEAASWASATLATGGDVTVAGADPRTMAAFLDVYRQVGGEYAGTDDGIRFWHPGGRLAPIALQTDVHPGFMTDWQQPLVVALTQASGESMLHETVYENRLGFTDALVRLGANIQLFRECLGSGECRFGQRNCVHSAVIAGPTTLHGAALDVPDLRGGFSYVVAALAAQGESKVTGISVIDRGYENFLAKLDALHADTEPST